MLCSNIWWPYSSVYRQEKSTLPRSVCRQQQPDHLKCDHVRTKNNVISSLALNPFDITTLAMWCTLSCRGLLSSFVINSWITCVEHSGILSERQAVEQQSMQLSANTCQLRTTCQSICSNSLEEYKIPPRRDTIQTERFKVQYRSPRGDVLGYAQ